MAAGEVEGEAVRRGVAYPGSATAQRPALGGGAVDGRRLPPRLLPQVPRLQRLFPPLGARPLPPADAQERAARRVRHLRTRVGILVGLAAEAAADRAGRGRRLARDRRPHRRGRRARPRGSRAPRPLRRRGAAVSFGLAGGLDPALRAGRPHPGGRRGPAGRADHRRGPPLAEPSSSGPRRTPSAEPSPARTGRCRTPPTRPASTPRPAPAPSTWRATPSRWRRSVTACPSS